MQTKQTWPPKARWLPTGHAQTLWAALFLGGHTPKLERQYLQAPDGERLAIDFLAKADQNTPLVLLFHGLEGSAKSHYARAFLRNAASIGWQAAVVHFRGCSGENVQHLRAYHAGDSEELTWIFTKLAPKFPTIYAIGVSLGGNALLKYLGEQQNLAIPKAAAAVSVPFDLRISGQALDDNRLNRLLYVRHFLKSLRRHLRAFAALDPSFQRFLSQKFKTLRAFDDQITAPLHGFADVDDYWTRASSLPFLHKIVRPSLLIAAKNDPFIPASSLPTADKLSPLIQTEFLEQGGHAGFVGGSFPGSIDALPWRILHFFQTIQAIEPSNSYAF